MSSQSWIKARLQTRGYRMKDVAAALGIPPPRVTDIIKGQRAVQADEIIPLGTLLGLPTKALLNSLSAGALHEGAGDESAPLLPVRGALTGTGLLQQLDKAAKIIGVPVPPDADTDEGLYCYMMGDDSLAREIRQGSLIIAGDPRTHFRAFTPGGIFIIDLGDDKLTARQYLRTDTGEHWLIPLCEIPNPQYESYRFSLLPADLDSAGSHRIAANDDVAGTVHKTIRPEDVLAIVMWVHRRHSAGDDSL